MVWSSSGRIRLHANLDSLPVILVAEKADDDVRRRCFEAGASHYLPRPFADAELATRVHLSIRFMTMQKLLEERQASEDLTGLETPEHFLQTLHREIAFSGRYGYAMTICAMEIDLLDGAGGSPGCASDDMLGEMADVFRTQLRRTDILADFRGGKFVLLLPHTDSAHARIAGKRYSETIADHSFEGIEGAVNGRATISVGYATYPGEGIETKDELMAAAQESLDKDRAQRRTTAAS